LLLMAVLPALVDADLVMFGAALREIQETTGRWFAPIQGGTFAHGPRADLVRRVTDWGAFGVGQSSWGPTVYGIVQGEETGLQLADRLRLEVGSTCRVFHGPFRTKGAVVWRGREPHLPTM